MNEHMPVNIKKVDIHTEEGWERLARVFRYAQVGQCVNGVTHDINNYLGAALAYAELVQMDGRLSEEAQPMVAKLMEAVERCGKLVSSLTVVARPRSTVVSMVDVNTIIQDTLLLREYDLRNGRIELRLELDDALPSLLIEAQKMHLALMYVLLNSEEALLEAPEPRQIRIRSRRESEMLVIEIWNNGPVIPESDRPMLFDAFTSGKSDAHLGLGLAAVRDILVQHGGTIEYSPERGFILQVPFHRQ